MQVEAIMTRNVKTCRPDDSLSRAAQLMWDGDCGCLPVVDEKGAPIGMITDRDICMAAYTQGAPIEGISVAGAMAKTVASCRPHDTVREAETIMRRHRVRRLPVTGTDDRLVGLLSLNDIACEAARERPQRGSREIGPEEVATTLGAICQHRAAHDLTTVAA